MWASVETSAKNLSTVWINASFSMMTEFHCALHFSLLSAVMEEMISWDLFSIAVYVQYWTQCLGLSYAFLGRVKSAISNPICLLVSMTAIHFV